MRANHKDFNVTIRESYQEDMPLARVIPQDLSRAVLNLVNNAFYAIWHKSQTADAAYKPEFSVSVSSQADSFTITFTDNGEGMTDEVKQRLFEHFFTTKPIGQGTGLGLGIVKDVVENRHHGTIAFSSEEGKGTTFTITIPFKK
jgi:signal transduction histidine kinase